MKIWLVLQVQNVIAKCITKCDDDTFVRNDSILEEINAKAKKQGLYMSKLDENYDLLYTQKWIISFEVLC